MMRSKSVALPSVNDNERAGLNPVLVDAKGPIHVANDTPREDIDGDEVAAKAGWPTVLTSMAPLRTLELPMGKSATRREQK